jgi:hypothetical protein
MSKLQPPCQPSPVPCYSPCALLFTLCLAIHAEVDATMQHFSAPSNPLHTTQRPTPIALQIHPSPRAHNPCMNVPVVHHPVRVLYSPSKTLPLLYSCASVPMDMIWGMAQNLKMSRLRSPCMNLEAHEGRDTAPQQQPQQEDISTAQHTQQAPSRK